MKYEEKSTVNVICCITYVHQYLKNNISFFFKYLVRTEQLNWPVILGKGNSQKKKKNIPIEF